MEAIYTITTLKNDGLTARCIGYYLEEKIAIGEVLNNSGDMCECGYYKYCVIERIEPGIYFIPRDEVWFEWNYEKEEYFRRNEKPLEYSDCCCYAIG